MMSKALVPVRERNSSTSMSDPLKVNLEGRSMDCATSKDAGSLDARSLLVGKILKALLKFLSCSAPVNKELTNISRSLPTSWEQAVIISTTVAKIINRIL